MTFLEAVNHVLLEAGILQGDDNKITDFSNQQHVQNIARAKKAIELELSDLTSFNLIPSQRQSAILTVSAGVRTYDLVSGFVGFQERHPRFLEVASPTEPDAIRDRYIPGGAQESDVMARIPNYRDNQAQPYEWYWAEDDARTARRIGFIHVPDSTYYYRYHYKKERMPTLETDNLPFHRETVSMVFTQAATRHFNFMTVPEDIKGSVDEDSVIRGHRARLMRLLKGHEPVGRYGADVRFKDSAVSNGAVFDA